MIFRGLLYLSIGFTLALIYRTLAKFKVKDKVEQPEAIDLTFITFMWPFVSIAALLSAIIFVPFYFFSALNKENL